MGQLLALASAAAGIVGTIILFFGSWAFEPFEGGVFGSDALVAHNKGVSRRNQRRVWQQRIGLALLCLSFAVQAVSIIHS